LARYLLEQLHQRLQCSPRSSSELWGCPYNLCVAIYHFRTASTPPVRTGREPIKYFEHEQQFGILTLRNESHMSFVTWPPFPSNMPHLSSRYKYVHPEVGSSVFP
jgi:hypothetical protein